MTAGPQVWKHGSLDPELGYKPDEQPDLAPRQVPVTQ